MHLPKLLQLTQTIDGVSIRNQPVRFHPDVVTEMEIIIVREQGALFTDLFVDALTHNWAHQVWGPIFLCVSKEW